MKIPATCLALVFAPLLCAQTSAPPQAPGGSVTGHVIASDTQRPARFATVYLLPKDETLKGDASKRDSQAKKAEDRLTMVSVESELDGSFNVQRLPPGDYFALATAPGYIVPVQLPVSSEDKLATPDMNVVLASVPVVHVATDQTSTVDLTMERGASISGVARYDDGTPVGGLYLRVQPATGLELPENYGLGQALMQIAFVNQRSIATALDDGSYRLYGLRPGKYVVTATLSTARETRTSNAGQSPLSSSWQGLTVYAPGEFRRSKAQIVELKDGEQRTGVDLAVTLQILHGVRGRVLANGSLHPIAHASALLKDDEGYRKFLGVADGAFHFDYVPSGTYKLAITDGTDWTGSAKDMSAESIAPMYKNADITVIVGEHDVVLDDIVLEPLKQGIGK
ncbi:carboxypeptidase-like regulatory domain-containing protein [Granulicella rosea]|nr:carboxypeptidase-like regulatory domain-containing protein [Granulicella rosea]